MDYPPRQLPGGTKTVTAATTPEALVSVSTPCRAVWVGAPVDADGVAGNTKVAFLGDSSGQNIPLLSDNHEGLVIEIDDAAKLYVDVGADGESVEYRVFS